MTLKDLAAYDAGAVMVNSGDWAEASVYNDSTLTEPVELTVLWGPVLLAEVASGRIADVCTAWVTEAALAGVPRRGGTLTRYPDLVDPIDRRETWLIDRVVLTDGLWALDVVLSGTAVPGRARHRVVPP